RKHTGNRRPLRESKRLLSDGTSPDSPRPAIRDTRASNRLAYRCFCSAAHQRVLDHYLPTRLNRAPTTQGRRCSSFLTETRIDSADLLLLFLFGLLAIARQRELF